MPKQSCAGSYTRGTGPKGVGTLRDLGDVIAEFIDLADDLEEAMGTLSTSLEALSHKFSLLSDQVRTSTPNNSWAQTQSVSATSSTATHNSESMQ